MDSVIKERFLSLWETYFCGVELPIVLFTMIENMDESFLITPSWDKVRKRIEHHVRKDH